MENVNANNKFMRKHIVEYAEFGFFKVGKLIKKSEVEKIVSQLSHKPYFPSQLILEKDNSTIRSIMDYHGFCRISQ